MGFGWSEAESVRQRKNQEARNKKGKKQLGESVEFIFNFYISFSQLLS